MTTATTNPTLSQLENKFTAEQIQSGIDYFTGIIRELEPRLEKGWQLYEAEKDPAKKERIYTRWYELLTKYEKAYQHRRDLGFDPVAA